MSLMRPLAIAALSAALTAPAFAEDDKHFYINPAIGYQDFDEKRGLEETETYIIGLEYRFNHNWAMEAVFGRANAEREDLPGNSKYKDIRLDGLYYFRGPHETFDPYLAAGIGDNEFDGHNNTTLRNPGTNNFHETRLNFGGGVRLNINELLSVRADLRAFHGSDNSTLDGQASLGLSLAFGGHSHEAPPEPEPEPRDSDGDGITDNRDQCPNTASGVSVDSRGCETDGDNDGVADSSDQCPGTPAGASVDRQGCELDSDNDGVVDSKDECPGTEAGAEVDERGCVGETESVETFTLNIQFPLNSAEIDGRYDDQLAEVAEFLKENPETVVEVAGHTDSQGQADYNRDLSTRRAESVAQRLIDNLDVDPDRVSATGYGESDPVADNSTAAGRAENRRVEARIQIER